MTTPDPTSGLAFTVDDFMQQVHATGETTATPSSTSTVGLMCSAEPMAPSAERRNLAALRKMGGRFTADTKLEDGMSVGTFLTLYWFVRDSKRHASKRAS